MKSLIITAFLALGIINNSIANAGDREWATAGKILTGVAAVTVINKIIEPAPQPVIVYSQPVVVQQPIIAQQQVIIQTTPVYYSYPVVIYQPVYHHRVFWHRY